MYKDTSGVFKTEVVTYLPDKRFLEHKSSGFSGIVKINRWDGRTVNTYLYKNNKIYKFKVDRQKISSNKLKNELLRCKLVLL